MDDYDTLLGITASQTERFFPPSAYLPGMLHRVLFRARLSGT